MKLVSDHHTVGLEDGSTSVPGVPIEIEDDKLAALLLTRGFVLYVSPQEKAYAKKKEAEVAAEMAAEEIAARESRARAAEEAAEATAAKAKTQPKAKRQPRSKPKPKPRSKAKPKTKPE